MGLNVQNHQCGSFLWELWYPTWRHDWARNMAQTCLSCILMIPDLESKHLKLLITSNMHYLTYQLCSFLFDFEDMYWPFRPFISGISKTRTQHNTLLQLSICQPSELVIQETQIHPACFHTVLWFTCGVVQWPTAIYLLKDTAASLTQHKSAW